MAEQPFFNHLITGQASLKVSNEWLHATFSNGRYMTITGSKAHVGHKWDE